MESIFFSVIIPTYNQASLLEKAVKSVLNQSFKNFEIIIVDNYSDDETQKIVESFQSKKIIYKKIENHGVIARSRNLGIKISRGKWLAFLDSDDSWYKEKLQIVSDFLQGNDSYDVICTDELIINEILNKKKIWKYGPYISSFYKRLLQKGNCLSTSASLIKKEFLLNQKILFNEKKDFITAEDYDFFMNLAFKNAKFKFLHHVLGEHLFYESSQSSNYVKHKAAVMSVVKHHVFNVQDFTEKREKMWNSLRVNFYFMDLIYFLKYKKKYTKGLLVFLKMFLSFPIKSLNFMFFKMKKG